MRDRHRRPTVASMTTTTDHVTPPVGAGAWGRLFAAIYNPVLWAGELAGMRSHRRDLLAARQGFRRVLPGAVTDTRRVHFPTRKDLPA
jgi:hypothetical protein